MSKWLKFEKTVRAKGKKTDTWLVINKVSGTPIGSVFWYGGFRKYVFQSNNGIVMDAGCMNDISEFLIYVYQEWKTEKKIRK